MLKSLQLNSLSKPKNYDMGWQEAMKCIASKNLGGLFVKCPICKKRGMIASKWIQGNPIKPLFIIHSNENGLFSSCAINKEQGEKIRRNIKFSRPETRKIISIGKVIIMFSGGKDSLCLLAYMKKLCDSLGKECVALHADTTAGFPEVERFVKRVCKKLKVPLAIVRPHRDYFELAKRWGIPGIKSRWCCSTLKIAPMRRYLAGIEGTKVVFDGIRASESSIRSTYIPVWYHPSFHTICASPLFTWSDEKVKRYIEQNGLPKGPSEELGTSAECWCGAYKSKSDFQYLLDTHPDIFDKLVEVEKAQQGKYTFIYEEGKRTPLATLKGDI